MSIILQDEETVQRPVPWNGRDVILLFAGWFVASVCCTALALLFFGKPQSESRVSTMEHPLTQLIRQGKNEPFILLVACLSGVIIAPIAEEFLFRSIFQGYLTKKWGNILSILTVSAVFGLMHGGGRTSQSVNNLFCVLTGVAVSNTLFLLFGLLYLLIAVKARPGDLGLTARKIISDLFLGTAMFCYCCPILLFLNVLLKAFFPAVVVDPIPLFFFSLVLGTLYRRTKRLTPCIFLHIFLNGFSFVIVTIGG